MPEPEFSPKRLLTLSEAVVEAAVSAGQTIMSVYASDFAVGTKDDRSPVTEADEKAEEVILHALARAEPDVPVVAEESVSAGRIPDVNGRSFFLVDPLDGTKEFISRNGEFTVNIALVVQGRPILGVVHLPAIGETFWSDGVARHAWRRRGVADPEPVRCRRAEGALVVVASRSHRDAKTDRYLEQFNVGELVAAGSSLKLCRVAEGKADMYPRLGRTMEWDIAAGHAVLLAAGGRIDTISADLAASAPLSYGKPGFENPHFVARGS